MGQARLSRDQDSKSFVGCYPSRDARGIWPLVEQFAPERRRGLLLPPSLTLRVLSAQLLLLMCGPPGGLGPLLLIITSDAISGTFLCLRERKSKLVHKD